MSQHLCRTALLSLALVSLVLSSCRTPPGKPLVRTGDEIVVAGQLFHTGTRVVTWMDPGGYDAYRVERRFSPIADSSWEKTKETVKGLNTPNRYGMRRAGLSDAEVEQVRGGGWELAKLQSIVDQFVLHFDVCGISKACFNVLHDHRDLSVHFMLDLDGTIYQTLDLKERAWHATTSNDRSVGIEIANMGAYANTDMKALDEWYQRDASGHVYIKVPASLGDPMFKVKNFTARPARPDLVRGNVQGQDLQQYDYTPEQYAALTKLTATLCKVFPKIRCDYPRDASGQLVLKKLPDDELKKYAGVIGHYHIQTNKTDPGPALQWDRLINDARAELGLASLKAGAEKR
jgi:N-acetyl-anhydromuramyl-L-alanine amidase AmpD